MAAETIEVIAGLGKDFANYGYLAFRHKLDESTVTALVSSPEMPPRPYLMGVSEVDETTEFEYRQDTAISVYDMGRRAEIAADILQNMGYQAIRRPGCVDVSGPSSLFAQLENHKRRVAS